ncbi:Nuclear mitotic apparatus protein 1 [Holothuria leucospilota]|uniref:Nuclear mitotic apparatus protein 1 n=1 Tax=Holothuria leucospilota TaxID=206669 RepID=A0A9Q1BL91_HOLLE|nr:Nuclear mitotic apparatus protein 1 [Holothuria leucospilota]
MDSGKLRALTNFVNAISIGPCIESLKQLYDGSHFIEMMKILNGSKLPPDSDHPIQRYRFILDFLEEFYNTQLKFHIDCSKIVNTADEGELAKVTALMLCVSVQGEEDKVKLFVEPITKLDLASQNDLKDIIEFILNMESSGNQLRRNFSDVLHRRVSSQVGFNSPTTRHLQLRFSRGDSLSSESSSSSNSSYLDDLGNRAKTPQEPASPFQKVVYQASPLSPVKMLLTSPHMANKINLRKMHKKIRELETQNASERALRDDLEAEVQQKNKKIADMESQLRDHTQKLQSLKGLQDKIDELQAREEEFTKEKVQLQKMKLKLSELSDMKEENSRLDKEMKDLATERSKLHSSLGGYHRLKTEHEDVQKALRQANREIAELKATVEKLSEDLAASDNKYSETEQMLRQSQQIFKEKIEHLEEEVAANNTSSMLGESLGIITEKRISELEDELNELRSTWIHPDINQALKDELSQISQMKDKFESSFLETKSSLLKHETECNHLKVQLKERTKEVDALTDTKQKLISQVSEKQTSLEAVQDELDRVKEQTAALEAEIAQTNEEKRQLQSDLNSVKSDLAVQVHELQVHQTSWEAQRKTLEEKQSEMGNLYKKLEDEYCDCKREMEATSQDLKGKLSASESKIKSLEALLEQERWVSREKLGALREEVSAVKKESGEALKSLQAKLEGSQHLTVSLRSELEKAKEDVRRGMQEGEDALRKAHQEKQTLEGFLKSEKDMVKSLQDTHQTQYLNWEKMRQDLKDSMSKLKEIQAKEKLSFQEKTNLLENELSLLKVDLERALSSKESLQALYQEEKEKLLEEKERIFQEMTNKETELMKQLQESREDMVRMQSESVNLQTDFVKRMTELKEENNKKEKDLKQVHHQEIENLEKVRHSLKEKVETLRESQLAEKTVLEEKLNELENRNSILNVELERARQENNALQMSLVSDQQKMFSERDKLKQKMEADEDRLRKELQDVKLSLSRAQSYASSLEEKFSKKEEELNEENARKEKSLAQIHKIEVGRLEQTNQDLQAEMEKLMAVHCQEKAQFEENSSKLKKDLDSLKTDLEKTQREKDSLQGVLASQKEEISVEREKSKEEMQKREDDLRKQLHEMKQAFGKVHSEVEILRENHKTREAEMVEEIGRKEEIRLAQETEMEAAKKIWEQKETCMREEFEGLMSEKEKLQILASEQEREVNEEREKLRTERDQWLITKERLETQADHMASGVQEQEQKVKGLEASLEEVSLEKKKLDMEILHLKEDAKLQVLQRDEVVSKLQAELKTVREESQKCVEEYRTKLAALVSDMESSQNREKTHSQMLAEKQTYFEAELERLQKEKLASEKQLQERVAASVSRVAELKANLKEATALLEENERNLTETLEANSRLEEEMEKAKRDADEKNLISERKSEEERQKLEEEKMKLRAEKEELMEKIQFLEKQQDHFQQNSGKLETEMHEKESSHKEEVGMLKMEKQQLVEKMNKLIELNKTIKENEKRQLDEKEREMNMYKKDAAREFEEIRERYDAEIETMKRGEQAKQNLLQQELESVSMELEHTKMMLAHETEALSEKSKLAQSASDSLKSSKKEADKEIASLRETLQKERKGKTKELEKLKQELLQVKTQSCSLQRKVEEEAQGKISEVEKKMDLERMELQAKVQNLELANKSLLVKMEKMEKSVEKMKRVDMDHSSLELSNADIHGTRRRTRSSHSLLEEDSLGGVSEADISTTDSLNGTPSHKLGKNLSEMRLDDLETSPRLSLGSSQGSTRSLQSSASTRSKGRTTIEIVMACTKSEVDLTGSVKSNHQTPYNLRSSTTSSQLDLPDKVTKTLDELCSSQNSLTASAANGRSHHTTGRANFVIVNDCDEEPEFMAWEDRIQELHRRNTLCRPHLKTSYPVETQIYAPDEFNDSDLKKKETTFSGGDTTTVVTAGRNSRKRKTELAQIEEGPSEKQLRKATSHNLIPPKEDNNILRKAVSHPDMPPPDNIPNPKRVTRASHNDLSDSKKLVVSHNNTASRSVKDLRSYAENKPPLAQNSQPKPEKQALSFDIGFSPKPSLRRRSMRHSLAKKALGRNSPKVNPEKMSAKKENKVPKLKKELSKIPKMKLTEEPSKQPDGLPTGTKKSRRRSLGKWLGK